MKRTWTIIGVGDVPRGASNGIRRCSVSRLPFLPMTTLGKSSIQMGPSCSASTNGVPTSIPESGLLWTIPVSENTISVNFASGKAAFQASNVDVEDYHDVVNALIDGPEEFSVSD